MAYYEIEFMNHKLIVDYDLVPRKILTQFNVSLAFSKSCFWIIFKLYENACKTELKEMNKRLEERAASRHSTNQMLAEGLTNPKFPLSKIFLADELLQETVRFTKETSNENEKLSEEFREMIKLGIYLTRFFEHISFSRTNSNGTYKYEK